MFAKILLISLGVIVLLATVALLFVFKLSGNVSKEERKKYINKFKEKNDENC